MALLSFISTYFPFLYISVTFACKCFEWIAVFVWSKNLKFHDGSRVLLATPWPTVPQAALQKDRSQRVKYLWNPIKLHTNVHILSNSMSLNLFPEILLVTFYALSWCKALLLFLSWQVLKTVFTASSTIVIGGGGYVATPTEVIYFVFSFVIAYCYSNRVCNILLPFSLLGWNLCRSMSIVLTYRSISLTHMVVYKWVK